LQLVARFVQILVVFLAHLRELPDRLGVEDAELRGLRLLGAQRQHTEKQHQKGQWGAGPSWHRVSPCLARAADDYITEIQRAFARALLEGGADAEDEIRGVFARLGILDEAVDQAERRLEHRQVEAQ